MCSFNSLGSMSHCVRRILCRVYDMDFLLPACYLGIHPRDAIPRGFLTKSVVCAEREQVSIHIDPQARVLNYCFQ